MMKLEYARLLLLPLHLLLCIPALWAQTTAGAPVNQRPGCPAKCGDVDIPFPFGVDEKCALNADFQLACDTTKGRAFFNGSEQISVTNVSVPDGKVWIKLPIFKQCALSSSKVESSKTPLGFSNTPYWISEVDNKIIVIGCRALAYMMSSSNVMVGCYSTCNNGSTPEDGACSGAGCCQVDVPNDVRSYDPSFDGSYNNTETWQQRPCNYMTLMDKAAFKFNTSYLESNVFWDTYGGEAPAVLNWQVGQVTCEEATKNKSSYACVSSHSECLNTTKEPGYRCKCSDGYVGNPYLRYGCQDICTNTPGSFNCSCHQGYPMVHNTSCEPVPNSAPAGQNFFSSVVGATVGPFVLVITIACVCFIRERRKLNKIKHQYFDQHGGQLLQDEKLKRGGITLRIFKEEELQQATNRFSEVLGQGGHATVYKGILKDSDNNTEIAVKRCKTMDEHHKKEFGKEMLILSKINHTNIVKLLGCCLEVEVPMLVYEFMPNGTLFQLIHGDHSNPLSLATRLQIAHESAEGLAYLHSGASPPIIHGDIKSSNILLDGDDRAKVSDFGASILAPTDESQFVTLVQGTCGYLDPAYMQTCKLTDTSDVYSFGVVLLELLTRKKALNLRAPDHEKNLSMVFLSAMKENKLEEILDDQIKDGDNTEFLEEIAELAKQCLEICIENRPSMKEVAEMLGRLRRVMQQHPWAQQSPEELESLLGPSSSSSGVSSAVVSTEYFSIERKAAACLESGR